MTAPVTLASIKAAVAEEWRITVLDLESDRRAAADDGLARTLRRLRLQLVPPPPLRREIQPALFEGPLFEWRDRLTPAAVETANVAAPDQPHPPAAVAALLRRDDAPGDVVTGADLAAEVERAARARGVSVNMLAAPLSRWPDKWMAQLRAARRPKPATVERVRALLDGREVAPPPLNNFQKNGPPAPAAHKTDGAAALHGLSRALDRSPCFRCGVRADIGCKHSRHQSERCA